MNREKFHGRRPATFTGAGIGGENNDMIGSKFLFSVDHENHELFILHREFPACLIQIVQTTPATFRIVDLYDAIDNEALLAHPFLSEAKEFWRAKGSKFIDDGN